MEYPRQATGGAMAKLFGSADVDLGRRGGLAADGISFEVRRGESGRVWSANWLRPSTTSMMVTRLIDKTEGLIRFDGTDIGESRQGVRALRRSLRKRIQMVFQDPTDSLNPRASLAGAQRSPIRSCG